MASLSTSARKPGACATSDEMRVSDESAACIGTANARATAIESISRFMNDFPDWSWTRMITNNLAIYCRRGGFTLRGDAGSSVIPLRSLPPAQDVLRHSDDWRHKESRATPTGDP